MGQLDSWSPGEIGTANLAAAWVASVNFLNVPR